MLEKHHNLIPEIIYEDSDILVLDKPAGMIVNKADTTAKQFTLQDWIEKKIKNKQDFPRAKTLKTREESDFYKRAGIVHRLDKQTSGIIIVAKNSSSFENLQSQFKNRTVDKAYIALVRGKLRSSEGEINAPIGRLPWNRTKFGVLPQGREAKTLYKVKNYKKLKKGKTEEYFTLIEAYPKTGRTHQIRVHLRYQGFPIVGDSLYGGRKNFKKDNKNLNRHFLHASEISFLHPKTGKKIHFEASLPSELIDFMNTLI